MRSTASASGADSRTGATRRASSRAWVGSRVLAARSASMRPTRRPRSSTTMATIAPSAASEPVTASASTWACTQTAIQPIASPTQASAPRRVSASCSRASRSDRSGAHSIALSVTVDRRSQRRQVSTSVERLRAGQKTVEDSAWRPSGRRSTDLRTQRRTSGASESAGRWGRVLTCPWTSNARALCPDERGARGIGVTRRYDCTWTQDLRANEYARAPVRWVDAVARRRHCSCNA